MCVDVQWKCKIIVRSVPSGSTELVLSSAWHPWLETSRVAPGILVLLTHFPEKYEHWISLALRWNLSWDCFAFGIWSCRLCVCVFLCRRAVLPFRDSVVDLCLSVKVVMDRVSWVYAASHSVHAGISFSSSHWTMYCSGSQTFSRQGSLNSHKLFLAHGHPLW